MSIRTLLPLLLSLAVFAGCGDKDDAEETGHDDEHGDHDDGDDHDHD